MDVAASAVGVCAHGQVDARNWAGIAARMLAQPSGSRRRPVVGVVVGAGGCPALSPATAGAELFAQVAACIVFVADQAAWRPVGLPATNADVATGGRYRA
ncbi:MAG: hypothetical protein IPN81_08955 [Nitrosomonadales bacterium]|nr:hypothetical protein [Nitrosomonadales bacterium]